MARLKDEPHRNDNFWAPWIDVSKCVVISWYSAWPKFRCALECGTDNKIILIFHIFSRFPQFNMPHIRNNFIVMTYIRTPEGTVRGKSVLTLSLLSHSVFWCKITTRFAISKHHPRSSVSPCCDLGICEVYRNSSLFTLSFSTTSTRNDI